MGISYPDANVYRSLWNYYKAIMTIGFHILYSGDLLFLVIFGQ